VKLAPEDLAAIQEPIRRQLHYFGRLRTRLEKRGFTPADLLIIRVNAAFDAAHALRVHVHYNACDPGSVGM
jgi:hypothetical protein